MHDAFSVPVYSGSSLPEGCQPAWRLRLSPSSPLPPWAGGWATLERMRFRDASWNNCIGVLKQPTKPRRPYCIHTSSTGLVKMGQETCTTNCASVFVLQISQDFNKALLARYAVHPNRTSAARTTSESFRRQHDTRVHQTCHRLNGANLYWGHRSSGPRSAASRHANIRARSSRCRFNDLWLALDGPELDFS